VSGADILRHLEALVSCDTQNPPRAIDGDHPVFARCREVLSCAFETKTWDHGEGHVSWFAIRGRPKVLFNVHLDTVPAGDGWSSDPQRLAVVDGRAYGRGACDIKGAAAVLLALAEQGVRNLALLFTTDEEGADGCCVQNFLDSGEGRRFGQVVVAEPTGCRAVLAHRGFLSVKTRFQGVPGHSSTARALHDNANHRMARWAARALEMAATYKSAPDDPGACFNLGLVQGGTKSNVIAGGAFVHWSARLPPGSSTQAFLEEMQACVRDGDTVSWELPFQGEPLPAAGRDDGAARAFCARHALPAGEPVDFWTEAALFSAAGLPVLVLGPGNIEQAHATDEWVSLQQLEQAITLYGRIVSEDG
jgi:acetylornithine deacetylase